MRRLITLLTIAAMPVLSSASTTAELIQKSADVMPKSVYDVENDYYFFNRAVSERDYDKLKETLEQGMRPDFTTYLPTVDAKKDIYSMINNRKAMLKHWQEKLDTLVRRNDTALAELAMFYLITSEEEKVKLKEMMDLLISFGADPLAPAIRLQARFSSDLESVMPYQGLVAVEVAGSRAVDVAYSNGEGDLELLKYFMNNSKLANSLDVYSFSTLDQAYEALPEATADKVETNMTSVTSRDFLEIEENVYFTQAGVETEKQAVFLNEEVKTEIERLKKEAFEKKKAEEAARLKAEEEARLKALEEARLKAEEEARVKAEEEARLKAQQEAAKAQAEKEVKQSAKTPTAKTADEGLDKKDQKTVRKMKLNKRAVKNILEKGERVVVKFKFDIENSKATNVTLTGRGSNASSEKEEKIIDLAKEEILDQSFTKYDYKIVDVEVEFDVDR